MCVCTPIKLALTYPLITQIALLGMRPFDSAWTTWTRYPGALMICVCTSILHVLLKRDEHYGGVLSFHMFPSGNCRTDLY